MADLKSIAESRGTFLNFDPRKIKIKPDLNARDLNTDDNREHIEWLADSIAMEGVKQPLVIFSEGDDVFVSDGHCRLTATMLAIERGANIKTVPCIPEQRGTNDVDRILSQNLFNSGKRLTPIEQGVNFRRAMALDGSLTVADIARRVGKTAQYVAFIIDFQAAPAEVHNMVKDGEVSASLAARVIREDGAEEGAKKLRKARDAAKEEGKARVTPKSIEPEDALWADLRTVVGRKRPSGLSDDAVRAAIDALRWQ